MTTGVEKQAEDGRMSSDGKAPQREIKRMKKEEA